MLTDVSTDNSGDDEANLKSKKRKRLNNAATQQALDKLKDSSKKRKIKKVRKVTNVDSDEDTGNGDPPKPPPKTELELLLDHISKSRNTPVNNNSSSTRVRELELELAILKEKNRGLPENIQFI